MTSDNTSINGEKRSRKRGDTPLLAAVAVTLLLSVAVIRDVRRDVVPRESHPKVDIEKVLKLIDRGSLSGREADYWEEALKP